MIGRPHDFQGPRGSGVLQVHAEGRSSRYLALGLVIKNHVQLHRSSQILDCRLEAHRPEGYVMRPIVLGHVLVGHLVGKRLRFCSGKLIVWCRASLVASFYSVWLARTVTRAIRAPEALDFEHAPHL